MKMNLTQSGLDEETAGETACSNILPELQKELESIYLQRLQWIQQLKKDPVHKKIMQTKDALMNDDHFDPEEAMEAAVNKRKFLIKRHLKDYSFTEHSDDEEDYINYISIKLYIHIRVWYYFNMWEGYNCLVTSTPMSI